MGKYDLDLHAWAAEQADALKRRSAHELDWDNLAEEIDALGKSTAWELYSRYVVLLTHLLEWEYQPNRRSRSWSLTIAVQRREIAKHIRRNPSLKSVEQDEFDEAYGTARMQASAETHLDLRVFPEQARLTPDQAKSDDWWPGTDGDPGSLP